MADFYWIGTNTNSWGHAPNWMMWNAATSTMDIPAPSPPQPGDNAIFGRSIHSGPFYNDVDTGVVNVNDIRIICPVEGNPAATSELLPNGTPSYGFDTQGFTMTVSGVVTCENFALGTVHTSQIPVGYHVGGHNADEYGGQQITITANPIGVWPYLGGNTAYISCTQAFYNNGGTIVNLSTVCGSYYSSGTGTVGYSGTCYLEASGVMTIENMRGNLTGLRMGAVTLDDGHLPTVSGGLTGGVPIVPDNQTMEVVGGLQINGNVTRGAGIGVGPIWRTSGVIAPVIAAGVTVNEARVHIASTVSMNRVFFTPGGIIDVTGCALTLPTFLGYGGLQVTEGTVISADVVNYHELYDVTVANDLAGSQTFGLTKMKVAHHCTLSSLVDGTFIAGANEIYVDDGLHATAPFSEVFSIQLHTAGPVLYPVKNVNIHSALTSVFNVHCALLTAQPGSYIEGGTGTVVTEKYTFNGANQHFAVTVTPTPTSTPYEAVSTHALELSLTIDCQDSASVTTILGNGGATQNPINLTVGGASATQQKVRLDGCLLSGLTLQKRWMVSSGARKDYIESVGPLWVSAPTFNVISPINTPTSYLSSIQVELNTVAKPGPVVFTADFVVQGDAGITFIMGGAATAMTHKLFSLADSTLGGYANTLDISVARPTSNSW